MVLKNFNFFKFFSHHKKTDWNLFQSAFFDQLYFYLFIAFFPSEDNHKVLEKIKHIIQQEDPLNPYSDQQISNILKDEDIICSRRTIQKYRSILNIPTKDQRKHF